MRKINVLLISNNQLSETDSNGKTLLSLFEDDMYNVFHFFVKSSSTPAKKAEKELCISDKDVLYRRKGVQRKAENINEESNTTMITNEAKRKSYIKLAREFVWKISKLQYKLLDKWLTELEYDVVFFLMGDSLFMCDIVQYIINKNQKPLFTYVTDVYTNESETDNKSDMFLKKIIRKKQKKILDQSVDFFTISEKMKKYYQESFGKESKLLRNLSLREVKIEKSKYNNFIYAGNLYYNRDKILCEFAQNLKKVNKELNKNYTLKIYSQSPKSERIEAEEHHNQYIKYCGSLDSNSLVKELSANTFALFVESFDEEFIEKVKYSFSTKITELAKLHKCIIAIGPKEISSIIELSNFSYMINNINSMYTRLKNFIEKEDYFLYEKKAEIYADNHYNPIIQKKMLYTELLSVIEQN